jgi:tetratricopeptide (TPR) repeat protein
MKKLFILLLICASAPLFAQQPHNTLRETGKEAGMMLDLQKISLGTLSNVEQKKQYLSTVQLGKQRIQNYTLRMVYENAYALYKRGDYQRAAEMANVILSIDPTLTQAQTLAREASRMAAYGTISEAEIVRMKYEDGITLYKAGRLVEARNKFEEILVLRPNESQAKKWIERIDDDIASEHTRRGYYAYKNGDYEEALNQWYSVLMIKKEDPELTAKIAEVEGKLKQEELQKTLNSAFSYYSEGKLLEAYSQFEKALEIQPGEPQTQKFAMQLKEEIANSYYNSATKAYNSKKYSTAISNWTEAKKWGYNKADINSLVKKAKKEQEQVKKSYKKTKVKDQAVNVYESTTTTTTTTVTPSGNEIVTVEEETITQTLPAVSASDFPTKTLTDKPGVITPEVRQASIEKYRAGLIYYTEGNYEKAKENFEAALQLNPENSDAALGLKRIEERYNSR